MEWQNYCRLCGKKNNPEVDIFIKNEDSDNIAAAIQRFFSVSINASNESANKICSSCAKFMTSLIEFAGQVMKVDEMFLEIESSLKLEIKPNLHQLSIKYGLAQNSFKPLQTEPLDSCGLENIANPETKLKHRMKKRKCKNSKKSNSFKEIIKSTNNPVNFVEEQTIEILSGNVKEEDKNISDVGLKEENDFNHISNDDSNDDVAGDYNQKQPSFKNNNLIKVGKKKSEKTKLASRHKNNKNSQNISEQDKKFQCMICLMKFTRESNYTIHMKKIHNVVEEIPPCDTCGKSFSSKGKLKEHKKLHLPPEEREKSYFKCPHCDQKYPQKAQMLNHIRSIHSKERPFVCEACGKAYTSQNNLYSHKKEAHEKIETACPICQKIFKTASRMRNHLKSHKEPSIPCTVCGDLLKSKKNLKNHMLIHSDVKAFKCNYCGKEFKRDITLQLHMIIHTGLKPFICRFCGQSYAHPSNCKKHEQQSHSLDFQAAETTNGPNLPYRRFQKLPNIQQLHAMLEDMKAGRECGA